MEDDAERRSSAGCVLNFNPRPPCGGRPTNYIYVEYYIAFQSTSPVWRTTGGVCPKLPNRQKFQSTSPVWRTTRPRSKSSLRTWISIHVPRVEDDSESARQPRNTIAFQSTSPVWRTTDGYEIAFESSPISIHVPRVEDDTTRSTSSANITNFNPRPPCGGRLRKLDLLRGRGRFQSTSPVWRTTGEHYEAYRQKHRFQSTSPVWRTTKPRQPKAKQRKISIHVPRVEDDV